VVTVGQTAAWRVTVFNNGGNTINHLKLIDAVDVGSVLSTDNPACVVTIGSTTSFTCSLQQLAPGDTFTARLAFTAPAAGSTMTNTLSGSYDPQTPNSTNQRGTDTIATQTRPAQLVATASDAISTYGLPTVHDGVIGTDALSLTHKQHTDVDLPWTLASGFGTPVQLTEGPASPPCAACVPYESVIKIPDSEPGSNQNPFTTSTPFSWSIQVDGTLVPPNYKLRGIYHNGMLLPFCSVQPITTTVPICVSTLTQDKKTKTVYATGFATTNGSYQFG
jgi:uncharacterized repeat protein (TIGR01451 family)